MTPKIYYPGMMDFQEQNSKWMSLMRHTKEDYLNAMRTAQQANNILTAQNAAFENACTQVKDALKRNIQCLPNAVGLREVFEASIRTLERALKYKEESEST